LILLVDNYDSFTYNLAHLFSDLAAERLDDRLMPEADPERRRRGREAPHDLRRRAGVGGTPRTG
jgi:hypothetical protein